MNCLPLHKRFFTQNYKTKIYLLPIIPSKVSRPYKVHDVFAGLSKLRVVADANLQVNVAIFRLHHILAVAGGIPP